VVQLVQKERRHHPRIGVRKLRVLLERELAEAGVKMGRDRFFEELRERDLLVKKRAAAWTQTTQSRHALPLFRNLIKERMVNKPNDVWVSDLTYLRTREGFMYLSLLTDKKSRKIVGYHCGETLETVGCMKALEMALEQLPAQSKPIHHSDRGCQYCSHEYVEKLRDRGLEISMTETYHAAENALAERMNGILKSEYRLGDEFGSKEQARRCADEAIQLYNVFRPHTALGYKTPTLVHSQAA